MYKTYTQAEAQNPFVTDFSFQKIYFTDSYTNLEVRREFEIFEGWFGSTKMFI